MSDAAISTIAASFVTIVTMIVGFLTLWVKLRYDAKKVAEKVEETASELSRKTVIVAKEVSLKADLVESKIDNNTSLTEKNTAALEIVHGLVNAQRDTLMLEIAQLRAEIVELKKKTPKY